MDSTEITIEYLVEKELLHSDTVKKHRRKLERFDQLLLGGERNHAIESQVTTFMTMFTGRLEQVVIEYLCAVAGADFDKDYRSQLQLISGGEFRDDSVTKTRRSIDLVVVDRNDDQVPSPGSQHWLPVVAVEAKYGAWVNAGNGYCGFTKEKDRHEDGYLPYSSQAICYPHGCIDKRLDSAKGVRFVWLGEGNPDVDNVGPWGRRGLYSADKNRIPGYDVAFKLQEKAKFIWKPATWAELGAAISKEIGGAEAEAIVRFLRAGGPTAN